MRLSAMIDAEVFATEADDVLGKCLDVLVDTATGDVAYFLIETGPRLASAHALFSAGRVSVGDGRVRLDATQAEVDARSTAPEEGDELLNPADVPPNVIGPFGYTVSPMVSAMLINMFWSRHTDARPLPDGENDNWHWFTHLRGRPVFDASGPLGDAKDIIFDPENMTCVSLTTEGAQGFGLFAFDKIRNVTDDEASIILASGEPDSSLGQALDTLGRG